MDTLRSVSAQEFDNEFGALHRAIFSHDGVDTHPFVLVGWELALVPYGGNMEGQDFRALMAAAKLHGDRQIIIADAETSRPSEAAVVVEASFSAFETVKSRPGTNLAIVDTHLFGRSGRWGCICAASLDDVALVGGDPSFVTSLLDAVGGVGALRSRFLQFATTE